MYHLIWLLIYHWTIRHICSTPSGGSRGFVGFGRTPPPVGSGCGSWKRSNWLCQSSSLREFLLRLYTTWYGNTNILKGSIHQAIITLSGGSRRGDGGPWPPPLAAWNFFASILILLLSRLHTMGRGNTKVAVCRRFLLSNRLVPAAFCCLCAVHCMQAAAASFELWFSTGCAQYTLVLVGYPV